MSLGRVCRIRRVFVTLGRFASASARLPAIFSAQFLNVVVHFFLTKSGIFFLSVLRGHSCWLEKLADKDFGAKAKVLPLQTADAFLLQILQQSQTQSENNPKNFKVNEMIRSNTEVALFLAPGAVSLKWMLKKMGFEKSFRFLNCLIGLLLFSP